MQSVAWLTLLSEVAPHEPMVQSYLAQLFFSQRRVRASMNLLRFNSTSTSNFNSTYNSTLSQSLSLSQRRRSIPMMLTSAALYLWCSQQRGKDDVRFLQSAK